MKVNFLHFSKHLKKSLTVFLTLLLFATHVVFAHAFETNFWAERNKNIKPQTVLGPAVQLANSPALVLSSQFGSVRKGARSINLKKPGQNGKVIIHIQDIHQNQEAQTNIGKTIVESIKQGEVGLIALEGAFGPIDLTAFQKFKHRTAVQKVANYLLKENKISGPIHALITMAGKSPPVVGIEDLTHYKANVEAYRKAQRHYNDLSHDLQQQIKELNQRKGRTFNRDLRLYDHRVNDYEEERIKLGPYVQYLADQHSNKKIPEIITAYLKAWELESTLDFSRVEIERTHLIQRLISQLNSSSVSELERFISAFQAKKITHGAFYDYFQNLCARASVPLNQFPQMKAYLQYVRLSDQIDGEFLFQEMRNLEKRGYEGFIRNEEERRLVQASRALTLKKKLVNFSLTREEWEEYKKFRTSDFGFWILNPQSETRNPKSFEDFYRYAELRDKAMVKNLLGAMDQYNVKVAVLVTGGFHSKGIQKQLSIFNSQLSYVGFVPKITRLRQGSGGQAPVYLSVFTQEKSPLDQLFEGEKLFLAQPPISTGAMRMARAWIPTWLEAEDPFHDIPNTVETATHQSLGGHSAMRSRDIRGGAESHLTFPSGRSRVYRMILDQGKNIDAVTPNTGLTSGGIIPVVRKFVFPIFLKFFSEPPAMKIYSWLGAPVLDEGLTTLIPLVLGFVTQINVSSPFIPHIVFWVSYAIFRILFIFLHPKGTRGPPVLISVLSLLPIIALSILFGFTSLNISIIFFTVTSLHSPVNFVAYRRFRKQFQKPVQLWLFDKDDSLTPGEANIERSASELLHEIIKLSTNEDLAVISGASVWQIDDFVTRHVSQAVKDRLYVFGDVGGHGFGPGQDHNGPPIFDKSLSLLGDKVSETKEAIHRAAQSVTSHPLKAEVRHSKFVFKLKDNVSHPTRQAIAEAVKEELAKFDESHPARKLKVSATSVSVEISTVDKEEAALELAKAVAKKRGLKDADQVLKQTVVVGDSEVDIPMMNLVAENGGTALWVGKHWPEGLHPNILRSPFVGPMVAREAMRAHIQWLRKNKIQKRRSTWVGGPQFRKRPPWRAGLVTLVLSFLLGLPLPGGMGNSMAKAGPRNVAPAQTATALVSSTLGQVANKAQPQVNDLHYFKGDLEAYTQTTVEKLLKIILEKNGQRPLTEEEREEVRRFMVALEKFNNLFDLPLEKRPYADHGIHILGNCDLCTYQVVSPWLDRQKIKHRVLTFIPEPPLRSYFTSHTVAVVEIAGLEFILDLTSAQFELLERYKETGRVLFQSPLSPQHEQEYEKLKDRMRVVMVPLDELRSINKESQSLPFYLSEKGVSITHNVTIRSHDEGKNFIVDEANSELTRVTDMRLNKELAAVHVPTVVSRLAIYTSAAHLPPHHLFIPFRVKDGPFFGLYMNGELEPIGQTEVVIHKEPKVSSELLKVLDDLVPMLESSHEDLVHIRNVAHFSATKERDNSGTLTGYKLEIERADGGVQIHHLSAKGKWLGKEEKAEKEETKDKKKWIWPSVIIGGIGLAMYRFGRWIKRNRDQWEWVFDQKRPPTFWAPVGQRLFFLSVVTGIPFLSIWSKGVLSSTVFSLPIVILVLGFAEAAWLQGIPNPDNRINGRNLPKAAILFEDVIAELGVMEIKDRGGAKHLFRRMSRAAKLRDVSGLMAEIKKEEGLLGHYQSIGEAIIRRNPAQNPSSPWVFSVIRSFYQREFPLQLNFEPIPTRPEVLSMERFQERFDYNSAPRNLLRGIRWAMTERQKRQDQETIEWVWHEILENEELLTALNDIRIKLSQLMRRGYMPLEFVQEVENEFLNPTPLKAAAKRFPSPSHITWGILTNPLLVSKYHPIGHLFRRLRELGWQPTPTEASASALRDVREELYSDQLERFGHLIDDITQFGKIPMDPTVQQVHDILLSPPDSSTASSTPSNPSSAAWMGMIGAAFAAIGTTQVFGFGRSQESSPMALFDTFSWPDPSMYLTAAIFFVTGFFVAWVLGRRSLLKKKGRSRKNKTAMEIHDELDNTILKLGVGTKEDWPVKVRKKPTVPPLLGALSKRWGNRPRPWAKSIALFLILSCNCVAPVQPYSDYTVPSAPVLNQNEDSPLIITLPEGQYDLPKDIDRLTKDIKTNPRADLLQKLADVFAEALASQKNYRERLSSIPPEKRAAFIREIMRILDNPAFHDSGTRIIQSYQLLFPMPTTAPTLEPDPSQTDPDSSEQEQYFLNEEGISVQRTEEPFGPFPLRKEGLNKVMTRERIIRRGA